MATSIRQPGIAPGRTRSVPPNTKGRPRKPIQPIDTNVLSYDRKDPFAAFNVLRKLLATLPSRIGGCQYRLTQEEHKLSMHLMTIVDPFIGLSPSRRTITRQPTEILDAIVFHIDTRRDLLALGLSCKRMHDIIFPRHYEYRVVRCKASSVSVWSHMSLHCSLAANVRRLEILDERTTEGIMVPSGIMMSDTELESSDDELGMHDKQERFLVAALSKMTALDSFIWSCNHSPISIDSVWPILLKCQSLKSAEINDNLVFSPAPTDSVASASSKRLVLLPDLTSVALRSTKHAYGHSKHPDLFRATNMLHHCPNLEVLNIAYHGRRGVPSPGPKVDDFLLCGRWPSLRVLNLTNLVCTANAFDAASSFFFAHLNLEVLHLNIGRLGTAITLPANALPNLRELKCSKELANTIMACPTETPRPLETLKGVYLGGQVWDQTLFDNLRKYAVKRLELSGFNEFDDIKRLIESAPKLTWLDVGRRGANIPHNRAGPVAISSVVEWTDLLMQLPDLMTFHGIRFFYEVSDGPSMTLSDRSRIKKNDEVASVLSWKCPKLRRLDHWDENAGKVIILLKDDEKAKWEIRRVKT